MQFEPEHPAHSYSDPAGYSLWLVQRDDPKEPSCLAYFASSFFEHGGKVLEVVPLATSENRPCEPFEADHVAVADERLTPVNLTKAEQTRHC